MKRIPVGLLVLLYIAIYIPYVVLTRWLATTRLPGFNQPLTGLEVVPSMVMLSWLMALIFIFASGWYKFAHQFQIGWLKLPRPTRWTLLSAFAAALILVTVPLSFTFKSVSIPFVQLMLRGDILIIAPVVDFLAHRRVHRRSWIALILTAIGAVVAVSARGGFKMPPLCWVTIALYAAGYMLRLYVMSRIAKTGATGETERYYVEEQLVAYPLALLIMAVLAVMHIDGQDGALHRGFIEAWHSGALPYLAASALPIFFASVLGTLILLNKHENSFCVPLERSGSILAGIAGSLILAYWFGQHMPSGAEFFGAALLILAIVILTLRPPKLSATGGRTQIPPRRSTG